MQDYSNVAELDRLLAPLFPVQSVDLDTPLGRSVSQGFTLPAASTIVRRSLPKEIIGPLLSESIAWIHTVLRDDWIVEDLSQRFFAVPNAVNDEDAFIAAWTCSDRVLQVVVTHSRVIVLTRMSPRAVQADAAEAALASAYEVLRLPERPNPTQWVIRPFAELVIGYRDMLFEKAWHDTLLFVTDGIGVKFAVLKYRDRTEPVQLESGLPTTFPWFPRDKTEDSEGPDQQP